MKKTLIFPLIFVGLGVACGGDDGARRGNQTAAFETVQEGSAAGVTSTIQGPGEALPPVTGTNADTTTAFSIDPSVASAVPPPNVAGSGTLAGTLPSQPAYPPPMTSAAPPPQRSYPQPRAYPQPQQQPRPVEREQPQQQQPPATDTAVTTPQQQPPVTNTNPPPQQQQPQAQQQQPPANTNPPEEEDSEEAEEEPPPPPTTTDTRGN